MPVYILEGVRMTLWMSKWIPHFILVWCISTFHKEIFKLLHHLGLMFRVSIFQYLASIMCLSQISATFWLSLPILFFVWKLHPYGGWMWFTNFYISATAPQTLPMLLSPRCWLNLYLMSVGRPALICECMPANMIQKRILCKGIYVLTLVADNVKNTHGNDSSKPPLQAQVLSWRPCKVSGTVSKLMCGCNDVDLMFHKITSLFLRQAVLSHFQH